MSDLRPSPLSPLSGSPKAPKGPPISAGGAALRGGQKGDREAPELRLSIGRAGLGIELGSNVQLGALSVSELSVSLPQVRFPLDVSGGVARFRHRRGTLEKLVCELGARELAAWARPKLRGILSVGRPEVWAMSRPDGATLGIFDPAPRGHHEGGVPALAFEVGVRSDGSALDFYVWGARGIHLAAPATALALAAMRALIGPISEERGAQFRVKHPAAEIAREILPAAGARLPSSDSVRWTALSVEGDVWLAHARHGGEEFVPGSSVLSAAESATLTFLSDTAPDTARARTLLLASLERAPRHPEVSRRIAEIDAHAGGRDEAALATLREANTEEPDPGALLVAALEEACGNPAAAAAAYKRAAESERVPALAALAWERAASLTSDATTALEWLDKAVATAPTVPFLRWRRLTVRLSLGRLTDAFADVQHLEAEAHGASAKFQVWQEAGRAWKRVGLHQASATLFERALRYAPDDMDALAGLGVALMREGRGARGVTLLKRAARLAEEAGARRSDITIDLARGLADGLGDPSAAIAHVRSVPDTAPEAALARGLEGRFRARLGDLSGASLAFEQLRNLAHVAGGESTGRFSDSPKDTVAALLVEAATFEDERRGDTLAAQRHVLAALSRAPSDRAALALSIRLGETLIGRAAGEADSRRGQVSKEQSERDAHPYVESVADTAPPAAAQAPAPSAFDSISFEADADDADAKSPEDELRAAALSQQVQIDPTNDVVASELALLLEKLGRYHELLALLLGRLEDATSDRRDALLESTKAAFTRAAASADGRGRKDEASLLRDALSGL